MAYEQHEWVNGETITAEKMNNIEEGIVEASQSGGGGGLPIVHFTAHSNISSGWWFGSWRFVKQSGNAYEVVDTLYSPMYLIAQSYGGESYTNASLPVPQTDGLYLALVRDVSYAWTNISTSGNISEPVTVDVYGNTCQGYIITGDFELEATVDAD